MSEPFKMGKAEIVPGSIFPRKGSLPKLTPTKRVCADCETSMARVKQLEEAITLFPGMEALLKERDALKARVAELERDSGRLGEIADALLAHCDKEGGECSECSKIVCPFKCELHFHHDGCPACIAQEPKDE